MGYPTTSSTLFERMRSGDEISWQEFYDKYRSVIIGVGKHYHLDDAACDEPYIRNAEEFRAFLNGNIMPDITPPNFIQRWMQKWFGIQPPKHKYAGSIKPPISRKWRIFAIIIAILYIISVAGRIEEDYTRSKNKKAFNAKLEASRAESQRQLQAAEKILRPAVDSKIPNSFADNPKKLTVSEAVKMLEDKYPADQKDDAIRDYAQKRKEKYDAEFRKRNLPIYNDELKGKISREEYRRQSFALSIKFAEPKDAFSDYWIADHQVRNSLSMLQGVKDDVLGQQHGLYWGSLERNMKARYEAKQKITEIPKDL